MVPQTSPLLVPTAPVPVPSQVGGIVGDDYKMTHSRFDDAVATGTCVALAGLIRLDRVDYVIAESTKDIRCVGGLVAGG